MTVTVARDHLFSEQLLHHERGESKKTIPAVSFTHQVAWPRVLRREPRGVSGSAQRTACSPGLTWRSRKFRESSLSKAMGREDAAREHQACGGRTANSVPRMRKGWRHGGARKLTVRASPGTWGFPHSHPRRGQPAWFPTGGNESSRV